MKVKKYDELNALKGLMTEKKITYRDLSGKTGISLSALNNKINGYSIFNVDELSDVVQVLNIKPEEISKYFFPSMLLNVIKNKEECE